MALMRIGRRLRGVHTVAVLVVVLVVPLASLGSAGASPREATGHQQRLHVRIEGAGDRRLLVLHGLGGAGGYFANRLGDMATDHTVLAPDLLGFGESPKPTDARYDLDEQVDYILFTLAADLQGRKTIVVGHSFGAIIALALVDRRPDLFSGAVLIALPVFSDRRGAEQHARNLGAMAAGVLDGSSFWRATCSFHDLYRIPGAGALWSVPQDVYLDGTHHIWESLSRTLDHLLDVDASSLAERSSVPLLFIHGTDDDVAPAKSAAVLAQRVGAEITLWKGGHQVFLDDPARVWQRVRVFERRHGM